MYSAVRNVPGVWNQGGSHFYMLTLSLGFVCLWFCSWFWAGGNTYLGWPPDCHLFTPFFFYLIIFLSRCVQGNGFHAAILQTVSNYRCQVSKACCPSMPKVMYICKSWNSWGDFLHSLLWIVFYHCARRVLMFLIRPREGVWLKCGGLTTRRDLEQLVGAFLRCPNKKGCIFHRPQSCAFFYAILHKHTCLSKREKPD